MTLTAGFLGAPEAWAAARLRLDNVHGLWGGRVVFVSGAGRVMVRHAPVPQAEERYTLEIAPVEAHAIFALCVEQDVLGLTFPARPILPDEVLTRLTLVNAAGHEQTVARWAQDRQSGFEQIEAALAQLADRAAPRSPGAPGTGGARLTYSGPFQAGFGPEWY